LAIEHPQAILISAHHTLQKARRRGTTTDTVAGTPVKTEGKTPAASLLGAKTPASAIGGKIPGSGLGSVVDMEIDSPLPPKAALVGTNGTGHSGKGSVDDDNKLGPDDVEEVLLDLATEILMAT